MGQGDRGGSNARTAPNKAQLSPVVLYSPSMKVSANLSTKSDRVGVLPRSRGGLIPQSYANALNALSMECCALRE